MIVNGDTAIARDLFDSGADAIAFEGRPPEILALAALTAHICAMIRRILQRQVHDLEKKLRRNRVVQQAKSILAERLSMTEAAAPRYLRRKSRDKRGPMDEIAEIVAAGRRIDSPETIATEDTKPN